MLAAKSRVKVIRENDSSSKTIGDVGMCPALGKDESMHFGEVGKDALFQFVYIRQKEFDLVPELGFKAFAVPYLAKQVSRRWELIIDVIVRRVETMF